MMESFLRGLVYTFKVIFTCVIVAVMAFVTYGLANYTATQGTGTTFASVVISSVHYLANLTCDPTAGSTTCMAVKGASTAAGASDPAATVTISPNSVGLISLGQETMASSAPVAIASNQSAISTTVTNLNPNGQAVMANSAPVVIASDQSAFPVSQSGTWVVQPTTSGGLSNYFVQPTAGDNHANIKNGAGQVYKISITNNSATINYVRLYNAASGFNGCNSATNLVYQAAIPGNSTNAAGIMDSWVAGLAFSTGISICVTSGYATNDTTNATASAISVNIGYK